MQLRRNVAYLLFGAAWAQGPSITDMLADGPSPSASGQATQSQQSGKGYPNFGYGNGDHSSSGYGNANQQQGGSGQAGPPGGTVHFGDQSGSGQQAHGPTGFGGGGQGFGGSQGGFGSSTGFGGSSHANQPPVAAGIMGSLLGSIEGNMPGKAGKVGGNPAISEESREIVSGIVEAFMHKIHLAPGEKQCLENNLATLTADVVGTGQDIVKAVEAFVPGNGNGPQPSNPGQAFKNPKTQGTLVSAGMDGAMKLTSLATQATSLLKTCVQGDALAMMKEVGQHFINMSYVGHRILVSGVDIAHAMGDSVMAYEKHDYHEFGEDIGTAFRKVILSNNNSGTTLPEGMPEREIIQETTEGLMDGFFVRGAEVEITDSARPDVDIMLNLHQCIADNGDFFKEIFAALWHLIAQLAANGEQHGLGAGGNPFAMQNPDGSQPKWMGELMIAMMQVPMALQRCNIGQESQQMMLEAIKSIQYLKVHFRMPENHVHSDRATLQVGKAITAWTQWKFEDFGAEIGKLLREFVLLMFPQAYSVDASGRLRRQLNVQTKSPLTKVLKAGRQPFSGAFISFLFVGVSFALVGTLVAVRGLRSMSRNAESQEQLASDDHAGASDVELADGLLE